MASDTWSEGTDCHYVPDPKQRCHNFFPPDIKYIYDLVEKIKPDSRV